MARKKGCNKRTSQGVTHPITTLAQARLTLRTGRVTRRAADARDALSELNDVESRACPVSTQFIPNIRSFRVHSDEFSIIRRVRRAPARRRGPHSSRTVRGAFSRERKTREIKPENLTNARSGSQKGVQHEDFPGGHPSYYYSRPSTLNSAHGSSYVSSSICTRSSLRALRRGK